jgi:peptide/nickel transport system permease protein
LAGYIARRIIALLPVVLIVATAGFFLIHLAPGDPAALMLGPDAAVADVEHLRQVLGLDRPLAVQLGLWYARMLRADLGYSIFLDQPVTQAIAQHLEPTILLTAMSLTVSLAIGLPAGVVAATRRNSWLDQLAMGAALFGLTVPTFWLGLNLILVFSVYLGLFPVAGYVPLQVSLVRAVQSLVLPALTLGFNGAALIARMARSSMLEVLGQEYIRSARAKGCAEPRVVYWHALRNALIPTLTVVGLVVGVLLAGVAVTETVFALPGIGRLVITSVLRRDYPVIQGVLMFTAGVYILVNLLVDVLYVSLDPRITYV